MGGCRTFGRLSKAAKKSQVAASRTSAGTEQVARNKGEGVVLGRSRSEQGARTGSEMGERREREVVQKRRVDASGMELGSPSSLISGVLIGAAGTAMFIYGKKQEKPLTLLTGIALCVFPMLVASVLAMWLIAAGCVGGLYVASRNG